MTTDEERVKAVWPDATVSMRWSPGLWTVEAGYGNWIAHGASVEDAWRRAAIEASRLTAR